MNVPLKAFFALSFLVASTAVAQACSVTASPQNPTASDVTNKIRGYNIFKFDSVRVVTDCGTPQRYELRFNCTDSQGNQRRVFNSFVYTVGKEAPRDHGKMEASSKDGSCSLLAATPSAYMRDNRLDPPAKDKLPPKQKGKTEVELREEEAIAARKKAAEAKTEREKYDQQQISNRVQSLHGKCKVVGGQSGSNTFSIDGERVSYTTWDTVNNQSVAMSFNRKDIAQIIDSSGKIPLFFVFACANNLPCVTANGQKKTAALLMATSATCSTADINDYRSTLSSPEFKAQFPSVR